MKRHCSIASFILLALAAPAQEDPATLWFYDPAPVGTGGYSLGAVHSSTVETHGASGKWINANTGVFVARDAAMALDYSALPSSLEAAPGSGTFAVANSTSSGSNIRYQPRALTQIPAESGVYFSALMQYDENALSGFSENLWSCVGLARGDSMAAEAAMYSDGFFVGFRTAGSGANKHVQIVGYAGGAANNVVLDDVPQHGVTYMVAVKVEYNADGPETVSFALNPVPGVEAYDGTLSAEILAPGQTLGYVKLGGGYTTGNKNIFFDELRAGATFDDVAGAAPHPVSADSATNVSFYEAVLNGTVINVSGYDEVSVRWGTAQDPATWSDRYTWPQLPGAGSINHRVTGLTPGTEYFFCFTATSQDGDTFGNVSSFATPVLNPIVETGAVAGITADAVEISGMLLNEGVPPTTVYVFCGTAPATWGTPANLGLFETGDTFAKAVDNLLPNTVYYYSFMASNDIATAWGATNSFRTLGAPALADVVVDRVVDTTARVTSTLSECVDARVWFVWWQTSDPATTFTNDLGVVEAGAATAQLAGLSASTAYTVQVHAENVYGSAATPIAYFTTTAVPTSFISTQSGNWSDAEIWNPPAVPRPNADVTIASGHIVLVDMETEAVRDVQVSGTLSFDGWDSLLRARDVALTGTVTHEPNTATTTNSLGLWEPNARVNIECANFTMNSGSRIDVSRKGYQTAPAHTNGYGPGGGAYAVNDSIALPRYGHGASHGGAGGGISGVLDDFGETYGDAAAPMQPGSSGGGNDRADLAGSEGGGAVRILATGNVTVAGNGILANGRNGGYHNGGGAGGSVYIQCRQFLGSGTVSAIGGTGEGGGGGGRIAVLYDPVAQNQISLPAVTFNTAGGKGGGTWLKFGPYDGEAGTLYFPDSQFLTRNDGAIPHSGQWLAPVPDVLERDELTLNNAWLRFPEGVSLAVAGDLVVKGTDNRLHKLELADGRLSVNGNVVLDKAALRLYGDAVPDAPVLCAENLFVTNSAALYVYGGDVESIDDVGASVDIAGTMTVASASWVYPFSHPTNGGYVSFKASTLDVAEGAGFDASYNGFDGGGYRGIGCGPGHGHFLSNATVDGRGGGHGGFGGGSIEPYGMTNDAAATPVFPGSGGGGGGSSNVGYNSGGRGGGAYRLLADTVRVDGSLLANGCTAGPRNAGGGAGGSILIKCRVFLGGETGLLRADGGEGSGDMSGGGGGGRIAVWTKMSADERGIEFSGPQKGYRMLDELESFAGVFSVTNGADKVKSQTLNIIRSQPGTVRLFESVRTTLFIIR